jgi:hypothetical protein
MVNSYCENSGKVTNYLNNEKHPDAIICDYNLPANGIFPLIDSRKS